MTKWEEEEAIVAWKETPQKHKQKCFNLRQDLRGGQRGRRRRGRRRMRKIGNTETRLDVKVRVEFDANQADQ